MRISYKLCALSALALALASPVASLAQKVFTMKVSTASLNDVNHEFMKRFKAGVEAKSGGRIKVDLFPAGQLGPLPRTIEGVTMGTVDMDIPATGFLVGLDPRFVVFDAPGLFDSMEHAYSVVRDPEIRKRIASMGESKNIEVLSVVFISPLGLLSHKPVRTPDDLKGMRVRAPGGAPLHIEPFSKLGMLPLTMPLNEALPAMQNKGLDGMATAFPIFTSFKYWDIAKTATELPGSYLVAAIIVNRNTMKSYGHELEAVVRSEAARLEDVYTTFGYEDLKRIYGVWKSNGGEILKFSAADQKRYLEAATSVVPQIVGANPKVKEDYEALLSAARKYRK